MYEYFSRPFGLVTFVLCTLCLLPYRVSGGEESRKDVRTSILAGTWYPGTQDALSKSVHGYLSKARVHSLDGTLKAIIVPHAGHRYSGGVAAYAYRLLQGSRFTRVVLIGPSHRVAFRGVSVNLQSAYNTPLGMVPVDQETGRKLLDTGPNIRWLRKAHAREHSLEIQLPFLQTVLHDFQIVPIVMGEQDIKTCSDLADTLIQVLDNSQDTLLLASTDLSHFHNYNQAKDLDLKFIEHVQRFNPEGLLKDLLSGKCEACGAGPVITTLLIARKLGADHAVILKYANSGDVTGDHSRVVGYMSAALLTGK
ncbi:MAG: AmmeMemoRadiSam system protein B [Deltaproteobacteria bacterium]|nr:AmmeMemoRadiSam system protein B [Deltaproteobacteria bacterium]MBW2343524.1 AmmeMemoRadiSam system protein B [Deltaproteobacteria bacterium]